jgi:hypothetical protein
MTNIETLLKQYGPGAVCVMASDAVQTFEGFSQDGCSLILSRDGCVYDLSGHHISPEHANNIWHHIVAVLPPDDAREWLNHDGGACPVAATSIVEIEAHDGTLLAGPASLFCCASDRFDMWKRDVARYRLVHA